MCTTLGLYAHLSVEEYVGSRKRRIYNTGPKLTRVKKCTHVLCLQEEGYAHVKAHLERT